MNTGDNQKDEVGLVYATQNGEVLPLEEMPDEVFAQRILGDGICILPRDGKVCSPVSGVVESVADTNHAFGIVTPDGADIMIHIGVDTVAMKGSGFKVKVRAGERVSAGTVICEANLKKLEKAGYAPHTAVLLTNQEGFKLMETFSGNAVAGETVVFRYQKTA
jgi:glucose-specific phosphotransferase system IIA component